MKLTKALLLFLFFQNLAGISFGQQNLVYNHYFINPYLYNPSYVAKDGHTELYLNYRKSWVGVEGAPKTSTASFQIPLRYNMGLGASFSNDKAGVYTTNTGYLSFAYQVYFGRDFSKVNKLGFGLSVGATNSKIDLSKVSNPDDPAYIYSNVTGLQGQFGLNYQFQNLSIGFALPRLLKPIVATNVSSDSSNSPFHSTIATLSYNFHLSSRVSFEPFLLYRTEQNLPSQYEVLGVLRLDNVGWVGAAYRQEYGASAFFGLNVKRIKVGYAYEFAPNQVNQIGSGSHEVQLIVRLSKKKKVRTPRVETVAAVIEEPEEGDSTEILTEKIAETGKRKNEQDVIVYQEPKLENKPGEVAPIKDSVKEDVIVQKQSIENLAEKKPQTKPITKSLDGKALAPGHYVVVGAFRSVQNAKSFNSILKKAGYPANVAFNPAKGYYIVHMGVTPSLQEAERLRDIYRQKSRYSFRDTWILTIE